jgi:hypothetical protein
MEGWGMYSRGRYKAIIVQKESYLLELTRYVVLNPVRARMVHTPDQWSWSSYRATAGLDPAPSWLMIDWLLAAFSEHRSEAIRRYMDFVADGKNQPGPWEKLKNQIFLGSYEFVASLQRTLGADASHREIPVAQRRPPPRPLTQIAGEQGRDEAILDAYVP